jgi:hypothetical protein
MINKFAEFFKITRIKIIIILVILLVITPIISTLFYPSDFGGAASGQAYWQTKTYLGIYPFTFIGIEKDCNSLDVCSYHLIDKSYPILTSGSILFTDNARYSKLFHRMIPNYIDFLLNIIINLAICYLVACFLILLYIKIRKK